LLKKVKEVSITGDWGLKFMEDSVTAGGNVICDRGRITLYVAGYCEDDSTKKPARILPAF